MRNVKSLLPALIFLFLTGCKVFKSPVGKTTDDGKLEAIFIQVNDVYEIQPLMGGKFGGMARVATLKKQYKEKNLNTFLVMAGDFVSPSVYNSLQYEGQRIRGKQMIESMNAAGMNLAVFGNHEFDITEKELQSRINESEFDWVSSNTFHKTGTTVQPFHKMKENLSVPLPEHYIMELHDEDGTKVKIGFIGLTLPFNKADYVSYTDPLTTAEKVYDHLKSRCDAVVAVTHQLLEDDIILAKRLPRLAAIIGGHEHDMRFEKVGDVYITKAHANAKSAYVLKITIDKNDKTVSVVPELKEIDDHIAVDSAANVVVKKWIDIAEKNYASLGFDAKHVIMTQGEPLDGRESEIRRHPTNFSKLIGQALVAASPRSEISVMNSGSIRIDDVIAPPVSEYDILRALPFGGGLREVEMKGSLLTKMLDAGRKNAGIGGYLIQHPVDYDSSRGAWMFKGAPLDRAKIYKVVMTDFLLSGKETNLDFVNEKNPEMVKVYPAETSVSDPRSDIRLAIVRYIISGQK